MSFAINLCFQLIDDVLCNCCAGDGMPVADLCIGSVASFNNTFHFLPGEKAVITCKIPDSSVLWDSPSFADGVLILVNMIQQNATRLDGAIVFSLNDVHVAPTPCATTTATIANIQESMQGLTLTCTDGLNSKASMNIDVVGKQLLHKTLASGI